ncbi:MAG: hypothetical protein RL563_1375 [Pseudomonadota bacterium]|jgi:hypothetical protein
MTLIRPLLLTTGLLLSVDVWAREINVSVPMNFGLMRNVMVNQLFTGEGQSARVWKDGKQCSFLDLSNPHLGGEDGQVKINNNVHARIGTKLGGKCMTVLEWNGVLETLQKPTLDSSGHILSFPVTKTRAYDGNGQELDIAQLHDLLQKAAAPKLAAIKIDLDQSRDDIVKILLPYISSKDTEQLHDAVNSLKFSKIDVDAASLTLGLSFISDKLKPGHKKAEAIFSDKELRQWHSKWQVWQSALDKAIEKMPMDSDLVNNRATLHELLQQANTAFEQGLTTEGYAIENDPVRVFLNKSWDDLAPLLRSASRVLPGAESLRYLTLIAATDLIYELETIGSPFAFDISSNGLRRLARNCLSHKSK